MTLKMDERTVVRFYNKWGTTEQWNKLTRSLFGAVLRWLTALSRTLIHTFWPYGRTATRASATLLAAKSVAVE
jgi:hypothetical protein